MLTFSVSFHHEGIAYTGSVDRMIQENTGITHYILTELHPRKLDIAKIYTVNSGQLQFLKTRDAGTNERIATAIARHMEAMNMSLG